MTRDEEAFDRDLDHLLEVVFARYHHDFRGYARASLRRRAAQALTQLGGASLGELGDRAAREPEVFSRLLDFLTVQVSDMFRDASFFLALRKSVLPYLATFPFLRVWIAGCSTGEEVYSLAILLREEGLADRALVYATDVNPTSLKRAQEGVFPIDRLAKFSAAYAASGGTASLADYYVADYGRALLDPSLRKNVVFSDHSLATDSVFAEVQLVLCRNVLIYFGRELQARALGLFADSLCRGGVLGLGSRETIRRSPADDLFNPLDERERLYVRR